MECGEQIRSDNDASQESHDRTVLFLVEDHKVKHDRTVLFFLDKLIGQYCYVELHLVAKYL